MTLNDYLCKLADEWTRASGRTLVALGGVAVNDGKFFANAPQLPEMRIRTFERLLAFFRDGSNWPDNKIPLAAADLLDRLSNIASETAAMSPDNDAGNIGALAGGRARAAEMIGARP